jgi:hypothetical protein
VCVAHSLPFGKYSVKYRFRTNVISRCFTLIPHPPAQIPRSCRQRDWSLDHIRRSLEIERRRPKRRAHSPDVPGIYYIVSKRHGVLRSASDKAAYAERLPAQLSTQPIAIGDVQFLQLFEPHQERQRLSGALSEAMSEEDHDRDFISTTAFLESLAEGVKAIG